MKNNSKTNNLIVIIILFILIIFIPPRFLEASIIINLIFSYLKIIFFIILLSLNFKNKLHINLFIFISFIYVLWRSFSSYYLADSVLDLKESINLFTILLLINLYTKRYLLELLKSLMFFAVIYITFNFLSTFFLPSGLYVDNPRLNEYRSAWFLGIGNAFAYYIIPCITFLYIYLNIAKKRNLYLLIICIISLLSLLSMIKGGSLTGTLSLLFILVLFFLLKIKVFYKIITFKNLIITYVLIWLNVVFVDSR